MTMRPHHIADMVGGAIGGPVAAQIFADPGMHVVVMEENERAYGKIEDGLPRRDLEQGKQQNNRFDAHRR
jgi:hypothetical protein